MSYRRRFSVKMQDYDVEVTVVDVYDLAADIGKECEIIIEKYGAEAVTALLPKVINALELLEGLAVRTEKENLSLQELTTKISQLENDKLEKAEYRQRFEKEIEAIEEQWRAESAELVSAVARLQDENKRLRRAAAAPADGGASPPSPAREQDREVLARLAATADRQRATLRVQEAQLMEKQMTIDNLTSQVEKLVAGTRELRRKHKQTQNQLRAAAEERAELAAAAQAQQRQLTALQADAPADETCAMCGARRDGGEAAAWRGERAALTERLARAEAELRALRTHRDSSPESGAASPASPAAAAGAADPAGAAGAAAARADAPVQGPLPREPEDAPWKRSGGIRKFFRKIFAESELGGGALPRPLSSLARLAAAPAPAAAPS